MKLYLYILLFAFTMILSSCNKSDTQLKPAEVTADSVVLVFEHNHDGTPLLFDTLTYTNSLGQHYQVSDLMYFISDVVFHCKDGNAFTLWANDSVHYINARSEQTLRWNCGKTKFPSYQVDSVSFTFGLSSKANRTGRFPNPPECNMFWPQVLGGGYHYMMMNLKWKDDMMPEKMPFMFHLGIGQIYEGTTHDPDSIIAYVHNNFIVTLPGTSFVITQGAALNITIRMDVKRWFDAENAFDFSGYPMGIMQEQEGMARAARNGKTVFSCRILVK